MSFPFKRFVIWGLRDVHHTHRFIHQGFFHTAQKLGIPVRWVENEVGNAAAVHPGDMVLSVNVAGDKLPIVKGAKYVLHNFRENLDHIVAQLGHNAVHLQVFTNSTIIGATRISSCTYVHHGTRTLIQPWGTNLLEHEFMPVPALKLGHMVFWVGSVWNNALDQGNLHEYDAMKRALRKHRRLLIRARVRDSIAAQLIRRSVISPAVGGRWQVENGYLPCRMFKNISYGQLGTSNIKEFGQILGTDLIASTDIEALIDADLAMTGNARREMIMAQQKAIADHTYEHKIKNMLRAFEMFDMM